MQILFISATSEDGFEVKKQMLNAGWVEK